MEWGEDLKQELGVLLSFYKWNEAIDIQEKCYREEKLFEGFECKPNIFKVHPSKFAEHLFEYH